MRTTTFKRGSYEIDVAWDIANAGDKPLLKGQRSLVDRVDGITLWIKPE